MIARRLPTRRRALLFFVTFTKFISWVYNLGMVKPVEDPDDPTLPGESLGDYLRSRGLSYAAFSRLVPCSIAYPGMVARGDARPSYRMAIRIEELTQGAVPRTRWYPPGPQQDVSTPDVSFDLEDL